MMTAPAQSGSTTHEASKPNKKSRFGVYFYGIVASRQHRDFGNIGVDRKPVYTVCYNDIAAVVSEVTDVPRDTRAARRQHSDALKRIRSQATIFPMEYREHLMLSDVKQTLTARYTHLKIQLTRHNGSTDLQTVPPGRRASLAPENPHRNVHTGVAQETRLKADLQR